LSWYVNVLARGRAVSFCTGGVLTHSPTSSAPSTLLKSLIKKLKNSRFARAATTVKKISAQAGKNRLPTLKITAAEEIATNRISGSDS
jgi:hypothetical protein